MGILFSMLEVAYHASIMRLDCFHFGNVGSWHGLDPLSTLHVHDPAATPEQTLLTAPCNDW